MLLALCLGLMLDNSNSLLLYRLNAIYWQLFEVRAEATIGNFETLAARDYGAYSSSDAG